MAVAVMPTYRYCWSSEIANCVGSAGMGTEAITLPLAGSMATTLLALVIAIAGMAA